jgi:phosphomevalonate kinase
MPVTAAVSASSATLEHSSNLLPQDESANLMASLPPPVMDLDKLDSAKLSTEMAATSVVVNSALTGINKIVNRLDRQAQQDKESLGMHASLSRDIQGLTRAIHELTPEIHDFNKNFNFYTANQESRRDSNKSHIG